MMAYLITNFVNGKAYIGVTECTKSRWRRHISTAKVGGYAALHRAMAKHGVGSFRFEEIACARSSDDLYQLEAVLIEQHGTYAPDGRGYNMTRGGKGCRGKSLTLEAKHKLAQYHRSLCPEARAKRSAAISAARIGRPLSEETKRKMSETKKGRSPSPEHRKALSEAMKVRVFTPETRARMAASARARAAPPEVKAAKLAARKAQRPPPKRVFSDETRRRMAESAKQRPPVSDETRRKMSEAKRRRDQERARLRADPQAG